jgi:hypothetical protein
MPNVAIDADGRAIVAWMCEGSVRARVIEPGASDAGAPETLSEGHIQDAAPEVGFDSDGWATVFWKDDTTGGVSAASRPPGGHFGSQQILYSPPSADESADRADFAVGTDGSAVAVWSSRRRVMLALRDGRGAFSAPVTLRSYDPDVQISPYSPRVAIDRDGDMLVTC